MGSTQKIHQVVDNYNIEVQSRPATCALLVVEIIVALAALAFALIVLALL